MSKLRYFVRHAWGHLNRERRRTFFVLFCIAAGVAAVVSLRTLGLLITDTLMGRLQESNRGDMVIRIPLSVPPETTVMLTDGTEVPIDQTLFEPAVEGDSSQARFGLSPEVVLSASGQSRLESWARENHSTCCATSRPGRNTPLHPVGPRK